MPDPEKEIKLKDRAAILGNGKFLQKVEDVMSSTFGEDTTSLNDDELVDVFYEKFRHVDSNTLDAMRFYNKTGEIDEDQTKQLRAVYDTYRALPMFWNDENVSTLSTLADYAVGIFSDPLTYGSILGGSGAYAKVAAQTLVHAGVKNGISAGLKTAALTGGGIDFVTATLGDSYIQRAEVEMGNRKEHSMFGEDEYSFLESAIYGGIAAVPAAGAFALSGAAKGAIGGGKQTIEALKEGKRAYLQKSEAGQAFLNNEMVEGSFVKVTGAGRKTKEALKNIIKDPTEAGSSRDVGYVKSISGDDVTVVLGKTDADEEILEVVSKSKLVMEDPFSDAIQAKIAQQVKKEAKVYNSAAAKEGFKEFQERIREELGVKAEDVSDIAFTLNVDSIDKLNSVFKEAILESGIAYNPGKRVTQNVADAILKGGEAFSGDKLTSILHRHGVSSQEFSAFVSGSYLGSVSEAARLLGQQGQLSKNMMKTFFDYTKNKNPFQAFQVATKGAKRESFYTDLSQQAQDVLKETKNFTKQPDIENLNVKNHISNMIGPNSKMSKEVEAYYTKFLAERGRASKAFDDVSKQRINRLVRLGMIAQPATTCRNIIGGMIRSPVDATSRTIDNAITCVWNMIPGQPSVRPVDWSDGIEHITSMFNPQEYKMITDFIITQKPDVQKQLFSGPEAFKESMIIQNSLKGDKTGIINDSLDFVEKGFLKINVLNGLQDRYMKSQAFIVGLKQAMRRDNLDLFEYISQGRIDEIDDRFIKEGIEWSLEFNYQSKGLEHQILGGKVLQELSELPYGLGAAIAPFPKFLLNSFRYMYEHSIVATPKWLYDVSMDTISNRKLTSFEKQRHIKRLSRQASGQGLLLTAFALRNSSMAGGKWNEIIDYDGGILDISTWYPLAPALWVAEAINNISEFFSKPGRTFSTILDIDSDDVIRFRKNVKQFFGADISTVEQYRSIESLSEELWLDLGKAFGGPSTRSGIFKVLDKSYLGSLLSSSDKSDSIINMTGQYTGSVVAALFTPLKIVTDIGRELSMDETMRRFREVRTSDGFWSNFSRQILKDMPYGDKLLTTGTERLKLDDKGRVIALIKNPDKSKQGKTPDYRWTIVNPEPLRHSAPLFKQITGAYKTRARNDVEKELVELGIPAFTLFNRTKIPEYDKVFQAFSASAMAGPLNNFIKSKKYTDILDKDIRKVVLRGRISELKSMIAAVFKEESDLGMLNTVMKLSPAIPEAIKEELIKMGWFDDTTKDISFKDFDKVALKAVAEATKKFQKLHTLSQE
jgi:hypothetical protein